MTPELVNGGLIEWTEPEPNDGEAWIPFPSPQERFNAVAFFGDLLASIHDATSAVKSFKHIDDYGERGVYCGTVPRAVVAKRRRDGKAARKARRTNRK